MMFVLKHSLKRDLCVLFNGRKSFQFSSESCVVLSLQEGSSWVLFQEVLGQSFIYSSTWPSGLSPENSLPSLFVHLRAGKYPLFPFLPLCCFPVPSRKQMAALKKKKQNRKNKVTYHLLCARHWVFHWQTGEMLLCCCRAALWKGGALHLWEMGAAGPGCEWVRSKGSREEVWIRPSVVFCLLVMNALYWTVPKHDISWVGNLLSA